MRTAREVIRSNFHTSTMPKKGRQVVVVKSLRDLSPRKTMLVSREPQLGETSRDKLERSSFGNHSPTVSASRLSGERSIYPVMTIVYFHHTQILTIPVSSYNSPNSLCNALFYFFRNLNAQRTANQFFLAAFWVNLRHLMR